MLMNDLTPEMLMMGFISYIVFLFSTTCHEASHALAAKIGGDSTAALGGQLSLNPIPHIRRSFFGMVIFPILSFFLLGGGMIGWASAPYDPLWERRHPRRSAWMALAGATKRMPSAEATSPEPQCWTSGNSLWAATMRALAASIVSGRMKFCPIQESRLRRRAGISSRTMGSSPILQASPIKAAHRLISKCSTLAWRSLK